MANKVTSPDRPDFENRGAQVAEAYYGKLTWDGASIIKNAELLHRVWTQGNDVQMHAIADGFRRQAYIIAQARAGQGAIMAIGSELWVETAEGEICILVDVYDFKVIAWVPSDQLSSDQLLEALEAKYPEVEFGIRLDVSPGMVYAIGRQEL